MTGERRKYRSACGWLLVAAVVGILVYCNISLRLQQQSLTSALAEVREKIESLKVELVEGEYTRGSATVVSNRWQDETDAMTEMLRQCKSREDFVVREGPRIAWSKLSGSTGRAKKIGIYLPAGRHWLKYAFADVDSLTSFEIERYESGHPREISGVVSIALGPESEVFELELRMGDDELLQVSLAGSANVLLHEAAMPFKIGLEQFVERLSDDKFAFPGEFKLREEERPYLLETLPPPVTDLGFLRVPVRVREQSFYSYTILRLWIESDARPCMPAIHVAANYDQVASLRYPFGNRTRDPDTEFNRLFEPYDGSGRFYFREEVFSDTVDDSN